MSELEQLKFWKEQYTEEYMARNAEFDLHLGLRAWRKITQQIEEPLEQILECGSNIGRNINFLNYLYPMAEKSIIEVAEKPFGIVTSRYRLQHAFNGSLTESDLPEGGFDFVFTNGVLIHIHPENILANMKRMYEYSRKYIMISEYFNRSPVMIEYRGESNKLFKSDFGKTFATHFDVEVVDYGFLWGHIYDPAGFDDVTYWLFRKK